MIGRNIALSLALLAMSPVGLGAQIAIAKEDVYLRPTASIQKPPIRAILAGDTVMLLSPDTTNLFLHARTKSGDATGWVHSRYVRVIGGGSVAQRPAPRSGVASAAADFHGCPNEGMTRGGKMPAPATQALNVLMNRYIAPTTAEMAPGITLAAMLAAGNDSNRFRSDQGAEIVGVVTDVEFGGTETANCEATSRSYNDTRIRIALTRDAPENKRVVVEVTPRWREAMTAVDVNWGTAALVETLIGRRVRVGGWMLFDTEHAQQSENTNPGNPKNARATAWEIHPVTTLEVLPK